MPENTVYVGRPTKWGNPFRDFGDMVYIYSLNRRYLDPWIYLSMQGEFGTAAEMYQDCVLNNAMVWLYCDDLDPISQGHWFGYFSEISNHINELKGKDLACWCSLDKPCHADVLLKLANSMR